MRERLGRSKSNTCAKFQGIISQKTASTLDSEGFWGGKLEPASISAVHSNKASLYYGGT